jgi:hypothetical protein
MTEGTVYTVIPTEGGGLFLLIALCLEILG